MGNFLNGVCQFFSDPWRAGITIGSFFLFKAVFRRPISWVLGGLGKGLFHGGTGTAKGLGKLGLWLVGKKTLIGALVAVGGLAALAIASQATKNNQVSEWEDYNPYSADKNRGTGLWTGSESSPGPPMGAPYQGYGYGGFNTGYSGAYLPRP